MDIKRRINWKQALQIGGILFLVLFVFGNHCPIENIIGIPCPGCNMFTAVYWLFHGNFELAYFFHPGVYLLVPYVVFMGISYVKKGNQLFTSKICKYVTAIVFICFMLIYIGRMISVFPDYPMQYNTEAVLYQIFHKFFKY